MAISRPARTEGSSRSPSGQCCASHCCMPPPRRASACGSLGGDRVQAWSTAWSCACASANVSLWNCGSGQTSPRPATAAVSLALPGARACRMMSTPERRGMGSPRLSSRGALSMSSTCSDQAASSCSSSADGAVAGATAPSAARKQRLATSWGHSSTSAWPASASESTRALQGAPSGPGTGVRSGRSSSPSAANFLSRAP
mmetsp:Transcript_46229/g.142968  ORF Transcript_46229/g.142968 Transcript_46229/m.142968 type:complete len:200 (+) Transcript_46229:942-1541(+)